MSRGRQPALVAAICWASWSSFLQGHIQKLVIRVAKNFDLLLISLHAGKLDRDRMLATLKVKYWQIPGNVADKNIVNPNPCRMNINTFWRSHVNIQIAHVAFGNRWAGRNAAGQNSHG